MQPSLIEAPAFHAARAALPGVVLAIMLVLALTESAVACGQMAPIDPAKPGAKVTVSGYGYGYEGGERPVSLVWASTGELAGRAFIDGNGVFTAEIVAPIAPGPHDIIVREGNADPAPARVTIPVVARRFAASTAAPK